MRHSIPESGQGVGGEVTTHSGWLARGRLWGLGLWGPGCLLGLL